MPHDDPDADLVDFLLDCMTFAATESRASFQELIGLVCGDATLEVGWHRTRECWIRLSLDARLDLEVQDVFRSELVTQVSQGAALLYGPRSSHLGQRLRAAGSPRKDEIPPAPLGSNEVVLLGAEFTAAWALLEEVTPEFVPWLALAAPTTVLLPYRGSVARNFSSSKAPLAVFTSSHLAKKLAEVLVHEGAHQVAMLCQTLPLPLVHDDGKLFTPAWRPDPRPSSALLRGAHAFALVAAWHMKAASYDRVAGDTPTPSQHRATALRHARDVRDVLQFLEEQAALAPAGRRLAELLIKMLPPML